MSIEQFTNEEIRILRKGKIVMIGNKRYRLCDTCGKVIWVNRPIVGSLHFCK